MIMENIMIRKVLPVALLGIFVFTLCQRIKNPIYSEPEPGRRDYVWELDTLNMPMNYIGAVWGASPTDVWAVGAGGTYNDRLLHYDGTEWSTYTKESILCGGNTLFGFNANDVWMGGGGGWGAGGGAGIWHYNGVEWREHFVYKVEGAYDIRVVDIWGTRPNDLYASGTISFYDGVKDKWRGFVLHFNGINWNEVVRADCESQFLNVRKEKDRLFLFSVFIPAGGDDTFEFFELKNNTLTKIYSAAQPQISIASMNSIDGLVYFTIDNDVFRYEKGAFNKCFSIYEKNFGHSISGRNENDIFLWMKDGIAHYNGQDIQYIYQYPRYSLNVNIYGVFFNKDVFFCASERYNNNNLIIHGKIE